jgi:signal peptidase II
MSSSYTQPAAKQRDYRPMMLVIVAAVILLDRYTKNLVTRLLSTSQVKVVIPNVFHISHVHNTGAAFSMFAENASPATVRNILIAFSLIAAVILIVMIWRTGRALSTTGVALALILGGALGNLYDRIRFHYVVDFLAVRIHHYNWPDFNVADSCICIGACLLIIEIFRPQPATQHE